MSVQCSVAFDQSMAGMIAHVRSRVYAWSYRRRQSRESKLERFTSSSSRNQSRMPFKYSVRTLDMIRRRSSQYKSFTRSISSTSSLSSSKGQSLFLRINAATKSKIFTWIVSTDPAKQATKHTSNQPQNESPSNPSNEASSLNKAKSVSQADAELRERLEEMSGEGGAAGIEYEDGKPTAMKRGVRKNMFRLI